MFDPAIRHDGSEFKAEVIFTAFDAFECGENLSEIVGMDKRQDHVEARCYRLVEPENAVNFLRPIMLTGDAVPGNTARHADRLTLAEKRFAAPKPLLGLLAILDRKSTRLNYSH